MCSLVPCRHKISMFEGGESYVTAFLTDCVISVYRVCGIFVWKSIKLYGGGTRNPDYCPDRGFNIFFVCHRS